MLGPLGRRNGYSGSVLLVDYRKNVWRWRHLGHGFRVPYPQYHSSVLYDDSLFLFGGRDDSHRLDDQDVWRLDLVTMDWIPCASYGIRPPHLGGHSCDLLERAKKMVVFGGKYLSGLNEDALSNEVYVFDVRATQWLQPEVKGQQPIGRYLHASCVARENVFIWGGMRVHTQPFDDLAILRPSGTGYMWSQPTVGRPRAAYSATLSNFKGKLILFGGLTVGGDGSRDCYVFDPMEERWTRLEHVPDRLNLELKNQISCRIGTMRRLSHHATVVSSEGLIIFGGHAGKSWKEVYVLRERK